MRQGILAFDEPRDYVDGWTLGGENEVDPAGTRLLRQARDQLFDFFADHHHEVS